ncbi:MAG: 30S ribosomal protein S20 [Candidatus Rariloculaceae bacterium]
MANIRSAKKRARQNVVRRNRNMALRSRLRGALRKILTAIKVGDQNAANQVYKATAPEIDRLVSKGILRKNRAARYKSRLNAKIKAMA